MSEEEIKFVDFDLEFQEKLVAMQVRDATFARRTEGLMKPDYFESRADATLFNLASTYFDKYKRAPSDPATFVTVLKAAVSKGKIREDLKEECVEKMRKVFKVDIGDRDFAIDQVGEFARHQAIQSAMLTAFDYLERHDTAKIEEIMTKAMQVGPHADSAEYDYWDEIESRTQERVDIKAGKIKPNGISTGIKQLDNLLFHKGWGLSELTVFMAGAKKGKCVTRDSIIFTEDGMMTIGDYVPLDTPVDEMVEKKINILGRDGIEPTRYIYNSGLKPTIKLSSTYGLEVEGTYHHPMLVMGEDGKHTWKQLDQITKGDWLVVQRGANVFGRSTTLPKSEFTPKRCDAVRHELPTVMTPELAEWLGMITSEGCLFGNGVITFTQKDEKILERYKSLTNSLFPSVHYWQSEIEVRFSSVHIKQWLIDIGVVWGSSSEKTIPNCIKVAPKDCVLAFLRPAIGLELNVTKSGSKLDIEFTSASRQLSKEIQVILLNLGIVAKLNRKMAMATNGKRIAREYWRLFIKGSTNQKIFAELGLAYESRKQQTIDSVGFDRCTTERDWIPNCRSVVQGAIDEFKGLHDGRFRSLVGDTLGRSIQTIASGRDDSRRILTYPLLRKFLAKLDEYKIEGTNSNLLREIESHNYSYTEVTTIEHGEALTVDFNIPKTHSFHCNGLISHNSFSLWDFGKLMSLQGRNVLGITLEVSKSVLSSRLDASVSDENIDDIQSHILKIAKAVKERGEKAGKYLLHEFPSGSFKPHDLDNLIEGYKSKGIVFDAVVIDYLDIMAPNRWTPDATENSRSVWVDVRGTAQRENMAILSATQTNREGHKSVTAKAEHAAEDFNKIRTADLVISLNATEEEMAKGEARLFFAASRNQKGEFAVRIKRDLSKGHALKEIVGFE